MLGSKRSGEVFSEEKDQEPEFSFDAFISYRHAELDSAAAGYLQKTLEHYRVPREIQKKCGKKSLKRIFRDEEELGASSDLFGEIEQNLKRSEFLLVICTPRLLESKWCMREIETFIRYRGRDNILAVLAEGEPETAFPPILLEAGEPLAVDIRGRNKREVLRRARQQMPRLMAPLLHCSYDELYQRHRVYRMRRVLAAAGVVTAVSMGFGAVTVMQNLKITENYQGKLENQSKYLASLSGRLLEGGDRDTALLIALEALPKNSEDTSRPYVPEARIALENALYTYVLDYQYHLRPQRILEQEGVTGNCHDLDEEEHVILTCDSRAYVWDADTGDLICCWGGDDREYIDAKLVRGHRLLLLAAGSVLCVDYRTGELQWEWKLPDCTEADCQANSYNMNWDYCRETGTIFFSASIRSHYKEGEEVVTDFHRFHLIDLETGQSRTWEPEEIYGKIKEDGKIFTFDRVLFSPDGQSVMLAGSNTMGDPNEHAWIRILPLRGDQSSFYQEYTGLVHVSWLSDGDLAVVEKLEGQNLGLVSGEMGLPWRWRLTCWNRKTMEPWFSYEDTSLALRNQVIVESVPAIELEEGARDILTVIYDNIAVNLDRYTGECYNRLENRSGFVLSHIWDRNTQMFITADGYLFTTGVDHDYVWAKKYNYYHYNIGLENIYRAEWYGEDAYFFTENAVYCYSGVADKNYTLIGEEPKNLWYNSDHSRLLLETYEGSLCLYDTADFNLLWKESVAQGGMTEDDWCVFLNPQLDEIVFRSLREENTVRIALKDLSQSEGTEMQNMKLSAAGASRAALWKSDYSGRFYRESERPEYEYVNDQNTVCLVLVDAVEEQVICQWDYQEIIDALPVPEEELPESWNIELLEARASQSGRYLILPVEVMDSTNDAFDEVVLLVWDTIEKGWVELPSEACRGLTKQLSFGTFYRNDGWVSPIGDMVVLGSGKYADRMMILDLASGEIIHQWEVDEVHSQEVSFTPDGNYIIFQDSNDRLQIYDWREGRYTYSSITPESGRLRFDFNEDLLFAYIRSSGGSSEICSIYQWTGPGEVRKDNSISSCAGCDGATVVIRNEALSRLYPYYHLDDLLAKARDILGDRELTDVERKNYFVD